MKKQNLLITGGLGLIGKSLIQILLKDFNLKILDTSPQIKRHKNYIKRFNKNEVKFVSCNILNEDKLSKTFNNIDVVIHLAAMLGVKNTESHKDLCWRINATATHHIVNACIKNKIKKLIFSSSSEVYGEQQTVKKISENSPLLGRNIYALSKISAENFIRTKLKKSKTKYTILRLFNTYGEGQVAQFFISKLCYSAINNKNFIVNGNGSQIRSYGYSEDIAMGIKKCIQKKITDGKIYNIGNSNEIFTLKQVIGLTSKLFKKKIKVIYNVDFKKGDRNKNREIFQRICEIKKAKKEINFYPKIGLEAGLKKVLSQKKIYGNWPT